MILETERLLLRELTQEDLPAVCDTLQNDEVRRVYEHDFTDGEAAAWIDRQRARYERYGFGLWAAQLRGGETIGMAGLTLQPCEGEEVLEIGYQLRPAYRGQGYAREAAAARIFPTASTARRVGNRRLVRLSAAFSSRRTKPAFSSAAKARVTLLG